VQQERGEEGSAGSGQEKPNQTKGSVMKNTQGFTLVEIMIVVAIIGLLAAIGIPSFQKARENALDKAKQNNVRMVETAVEQWGMEGAVTNGYTITSTDATNIAAYIKGGYGALKVGTLEVTAAKVTGKTMGHVFTTGDLY